MFLNWNSQKVLFVWHVLFTITKLILFGFINRYRQTAVVCRKTRYNSRLSFLFNSLVVRATLGQLDPQMDKWLDYICIVYSWKSADQGGIPLECNTCRWNCLFSLITPFLWHLFATADLSTHVAVFNFSTNKTLPWRYKHMSHSQS